MESWTPSDLAATLERMARVEAPIAEAGGLPNEAYTAEAYAAFERDRVLGATWTAVGVGRQVQAPGDLQPVTLLGLPLFLARDGEGRVRVFLNVCSHRGLVLGDEARQGERLIRCPYHAWAYALDGALKATPQIGGPGTHDCPGFDRGKHGLKEVRSAVWCDTVYVNLSGTAPDFARFIAPLAERWGGFAWDALRHGGADSAFELTLDCNWKLAVENYCEAYHLPWIHPNLNSYSRLEDHYDIAETGLYAGQGSRAYRPSLSDDGRTFPLFPDLPQGWAGAAEYIALFPNVLYGLHADHFYSVVVLPEAAGRTRELFEIYYVGEAPLDDAYAGLRAANTRQWRGIFEEDRGVVEGMQRGRASPGFQGGAFSPAMDGPTHCFHRWAAAAVTAAAA